MPKNGSIFGRRRSRSRCAPYRAAPAGCGGYRIGLLLHIDVDQLAGMGGLDPADDPTALSVEVGEPAHPVALEDPVKCGCWHADPRASRTGPSW